MQGLDHIIMVKERLLKMPAGRNMMVLPLHSQLPAGDQRSAFARPPAGLRKVLYFLQLVNNLFVFGLAVL